MADLTKAELAAKVAELEKELDGKVIIISGHELTIAEMQKVVALLEAENKKVKEENAALIQCHANYAEAEAELEARIEELYKKLSDSESQKEEEQVDTLSVLQLEAKWKLHLSTPFDLDSFLDYFPYYFKTNPKGLKRIGFDSVQLTY